MKKIFLLLLLLTTPAFASNWYVNKAATGTGAGTSWTNAWTDFNSINYSSVACGDTIWVAGGNYTHTITATKVCTSGNALTIQRVLATDAVPVASPGWSSGFDSTVHTAGAVCDLEGDYTTISGRIPSGWVGTTTAGGGNSCVGALTRSITGDTLDHIQFVGPACAPAGNCSVGAYGVNIVPATNTVTNFTVQYCELFNMSETFREENWENSVVQYNSIHDTFNDGIDHEDIVYSYPFGPSGVVIWRYNTIYNSPNDGIFFEFGGANSFEFYRNVFYGSQFSLMTTKAPGTYGPILLYNNIFASTTGPCSSNCAFLNDNGSTMTGVQVYNNVFYYVANSMAGRAGETSDYNAYSYTTLNGFSWPSSETHSFHYNPGTQNPFVNVATGDFHLSSLSTVMNGVGKTLATDGFQNVDMDGNVATTPWNVGAFNNPPTTQTWYIRTDGGTAAQCTGHVNAAYSGSGSAQPCALNHPFWMMDFSGAWRSDYHGGDTVQFEDQGPYFIGEKNGTLGTDWHGLGFSAICDSPSSGFSSACTFPPDGPPSGTSGSTTKWYGKNVGACHTSDGSNLQNPTVFQPVSAPFYMFSVQNSSWGDVECIDIAPTDTCTDAGTGAGQCTTTSNFAGSGIHIEYQTAQGPSNYILKDVGVHGMAGQGVLGSHINQSPGDFFTASYIYIRGNGLAGWDSDGGSCGTSCETVGTMTLDHLRVEFNGCVQQGTTGGYNATTGTWAAGYNYCYAQSTTGYGDGLSFIAAGNVTFTLTNSYARWNTQDGFDLLHLGDDQTHTQTLNVKNNWSEGNMGQTFKIGGAANTTAWDNFSNGNCRVMIDPTVFPMTLNPSGYSNGLGSDVCRSAGDEWAINLSDGHSVNMIHNTSVGYGATMYDVGCASTCTGTDLFVFEDNISVGYPDPGNEGVYPGGFFMQDGLPDPFGNAGSSITHNLWYKLRNDTCPQDPTYETNYQCGDPLLTAESDVNAITPTLTSSSPAIANGITAGPTLDYYGNAFASPPAIGFAEFTGGTPTAAEPTFSPVAGTYSSTQTVTLSTSTGGATICYTTDGSTPLAATPGTCSHGTTYSTPVSVATTTTIKAIATEASFLNSGVGTAAYTITIPAAPSFSVSGTVTFSGAGSIQ